MEQTLPKLLRETAQKHPETASHYYKGEKDQFVPVLYKDYYQTALNFGAGLLDCGIKRNDHIGLISDNRKEWSFADMGLLAIGAIDVPRGCDATENDLRYILDFADCKTVIAENASQIKKILGLRNDLPKIEQLICFEELSDEDINKIKDAEMSFLSFSDVMARGIEFRKNNPNKVEDELEKGQWDDLATIIFTSGTTGNPKGVMLTHGNFLTQLDELPERILISPDGKAICVLPIWHAFQRICEYVILAKAAAICYSKPVGSVLLADFIKLNPQILPGVPRVFEAIYDGIFRTMRKTGGITFVLFKFFIKVGILFSRIERILFSRNAQYKKTFKPLLWLVFVLPWLLLYPLKLLGDVLVFKKIRAKLGTSFIGGVSGGGALPPAVDEFFWAIGVSIVEGYGLTETAPVVAVRPQTKPIFGTVGRPIRHVEVRITDETGTVLKPGEKGSVWVRGDIVMKGYYKRPELTAKVMDKDNWFDTGDLGTLTINGELVLKGRKKDTIVLRGGENIEPLPIEMKLCESRFISNAVVLGQNVNGQDQRFLGALIVPSKDDLLSFANDSAIQYKEFKDLLVHPEVLKMYEDEIKNLINSKTGFKLFERINKFVLLEKPFEVGVELSAKQEIMRYKMASLYPKQISQLFKD